MLPAVILFLLFWIAVISSFVMWCRETRRANEFEKKFRDAEKEIRKLERSKRLGRSAFEVWQALEGNAGKSEKDFIEAYSVDDIVLTIDSISQPPLGEKTRKAGGYPRASAPPLEPGRRNPLPKIPPKGPPPAPPKRHGGNVTHIHHHHQYGPDLGTGEPLSAPRCSPRGSDNDYGGSSGSDNSGPSE